ncbi:hypothetical protein EJB05_21370, partial [Eragrostis curvula]
FPHLKNSGSGFQKAQTQAIAAISAIKSTSPQLPKATPFLPSPSGRGPSTPPVGGRAFLWVRGRLTPSSSCVDCLRLARRQRDDSSRCSVVGAI